MCALAGQPDGFRDRLGDERRDQPWDGGRSGWEMGNVKWEMSVTSHLPFTISHFPSEVPAGSEREACRDFSSFGHDDDPVADVVAVAIGVIHAGGVDEPHAVADPGV